MNPDTTQPLLPRLAKANDLLAKASLMITETDNPLFATINEKIKNTLLTIAVAGEIKKGKSSFINALLSEPGLVPVAEDVATSCVSKIHYGPKVAHRVHFLPDDEGKVREPLDIAPEEVGDYGSEAGNKHNKKNVDFIAISCPSDFLKTGVVIVDTPGIGGLVTSHKAITYRFLPDADAVFYVTDSATPFDQTDLDFLKEISKATEHIYILQSKTDTAASSDASVQICQRNIKELKSHLRIESPRYFPISSRLKSLADKSGDPDDMEDSGFAPVHKFILHDLRDEQERIITHQCCNHLSGVANNLQSELKTRSALYAEKTGEELRRIDEELSEKETRWREWQNTSLPEIQKGFETDIQQLTASTYRRLKETFGPTGEIAQNAKQQIEACQDQQELEAGANNLMKGIVDLSLDRLAEVQKELVVDFITIASKTEKKFAVDMPIDLHNAIVPYDTSSNYELVSPTISNGDEFGKMTIQLQRAMYWGGLAASAGFYLLPGLGFLFAGGIGLVLGWLKANQGQNASQLQHTKCQLQQKVGEQLVKLMPQAEEVVTNLLADGKRTLIERVKKLAQSQLSSLDRERKEILKVRQDSVEQRKSREESFRVMDATLSAGFADVKALLKDSSET